MDAFEAEYRRRLQAALGDGFELRELVGRGGFGAVYSAWDKALEREVAVKALRHDLFPTPVVLERFRREAKALAQLRHPHILPVYGVGDGEGLAFMIMPFIRGDNLRGASNLGALGVRDAVRITGEVARALDAAHRVGIVHRDVKPENILLDGADRHAVLADFGIAKPAQGEGGLTGTGIAIGSPEYMSPEQAAADKEIDARSDIYSLGTVAYELLAGRRPYVAASLQRLLVLQMTTEPTPLSSVAPSVPAPVADAVMRALAREPADRWQTAGEFAAALTAAPAAVEPERRESWFARRGLLLAFIDLLGVYITITSVVLIEASGRTATVLTAVNLLRVPFLIVVLLVFWLAILELIVIVVRKRPSRSDGTWQPALRAAFGQPRWWQVWYPRSLRSTDSAWDRMPLEVKFLRTVLWLDLAAIPLAVPLLFGVPQLQRIAASADMALPLPARLVIAASAFMQRGPGYVGIGLALFGTVALAFARRVRISDVVALLLTWREKAWSSEAGLLLSITTATARGVPAVGTPRPRWVAMAAFVLAAAAYAVWSGARARADGPRSIAVLPCENVSGDSSADYLAEGLSDEVRSALTGVPGLSVKARTSSLVFRGPQADLRRLASKLGVQEVLQCSLRSSGSQMRVTAELLRVPAGDALWAHTYVESAMNFQALRDSISTAVATRLALRTLSSQPGLALRGTKDHEAYNLFLKGEFHRRKWNFPAAIALLRQAVARDPQFGRAHAALAAAYASLPLAGFASPDSTRALADASAARARSLDSTDVLALFAEGFLLYADLRMVEAERVFARIMDRDSTNAEAMYGRSSALAWLGRLDEAYAISLAGRRFDPLSVDMNGLVAYELYVKRQFREAIAETKPALEVDPNWVVALENLAVAYAFAGQHDSAVVVARRVVSIGASNFGGRAYLMFAFAAAGHWSEADEQRRLLAAETSNSPEFNRAFTNVVYGRRDAAMTALARAFRDREPLIAINFIGCDPMWDLLKSDQRFAELLTRRGAVMCPPLKAWPIGKRP